MRDVSTGGNVAALRDGAPHTAASWPWLVLAVWLVMAVLLLIVSAGAIAAVRFTDPDDALRLVQVRDWLGGQSWFDVHQYRIAAPEGVLMHWSRLVDVPLAAMIVLLRPLVGTAQAELITLVTVPLLTLLITLMLVGRLTARFYNGEAVVMVCLVTSFGLQLLFQMTPLRIDHHGWQVVLALVAVNGLAARDAVRGGLIIGIALAALLAVSIEGLPITAVFLGVLALRGLFEPARRPFAGFAAAASALALASGAIFLGTRGMADLVTHCDQISPVHLALLAIVALGGAGLALKAPQRWPAVLGAFAVIGGVTLASAWLSLPQCRGGAFSMLDPLVYRLWYGHVTEGLPVWELPLPMALETVGLPLVGLFASALLWRDAASAAEKAWWRDHALLVAGALAIAILFQRASATASGIAALSTGVLIMRWLIALRTQRPLRRGAGYLVILAMLLPPMPLLAWTLLSAPFAPAAGPAARQAPGGKCDYAMAGRALDTLPATDILMPLDIGAFILARSHQRVVATDHHRGAAAMHDVVSAFVGSADEAHAMIRRRQVTLIVVCPNVGEPATYRLYAPHGFMAQLLDNQTPDWLQKVDLAPGSNMLFWKVRG
ncbi:hypothetical protein [Novosphingobium sp.]|uniref:hypothetical protein n=1 Tax=Novosphingobium sp. TaxID=1874826 RepID=UPI003BAB519E